MGVPGSYANLEGLSPWTKDKLSPEEYLRKEVVELNNGRLAMLACIGLWAQELVQGGQPVMFTLKNPSSTEFAYGLPGNQIPGVPSSRFDFDPLGFAERASPAEMVKYREAELKHGRVAMLAITGMLFAEVWHPMLYAPSNVPAIFAFQG